MSYIDPIKASLQAERGKIAALLEKADHPITREAGWEAKDIRREDDIRNGVVKSLCCQLGKIDRALERIEEGTYGLCIACDKVIPSELLGECPALEKCPECLKSAKTSLPPSAKVLRSVGH